jgi:hypothetical protein
MGLYLCVFADDADGEELEGVEVGGYDDFGLLRQAVADRLEPAGWGSRFPVLMSHPTPMEPGVLRRPAAWRQTC